eukprot:1479220-Lingulodinium_polyedra.AAC.1
MCPGRGGARSERRGWRVLVLRRRCCPPNPDEARQEAPRVRCMQRRALRCPRLGFGTRSPTRGG